MQRIGGQLVGREEELGSMEVFLDETATRPAALVVSGEPGIGKTILLEAAVAEARTRFPTVLTCRGVEAEARFAFAGLSELLADALDDVGRSLAAPRRRALEVALLVAEPDDHPPNAHAVGLALLDVLGEFAKRGPVLVAVDDLQWLDPSTAGVLQIALRRVRDEPVGVLATVREAPRIEVPLDLERVLPEGSVTCLRLGALGIGTLHRLLKIRLGLELARPELARVQEVSAGNPLFALELAGELGRMGERREPGEPLPVPDSLTRLLGVRLARLPADTADVLLIAAAAGEPTIDELTAADGSREHVLAALEPAERDGVVELRERVRFAHPLLASVCYELAPAPRRRAVHHSLGEALSDVEERARHLALAAEGANAAVADELETAANRAAARGATAAAGELFEFAARLTPGSPVLARGRRLQAANLHRLAGNIARAVSILEDLLTEVPAGVERADVLFALAPTVREGPRAMIAACDEALVHAAGDDARAARILALRSWLFLLELHPPRAVADGRAALEHAERVGDPLLIAVAIGQLGHAELLCGEATPGLLERGVEIEARLGVPLEYHNSPRISLARLLMRRGNLDEARAILEEVAAGMEARGDEGRGQILWELSNVEWLAGQLHSGLEHARAGYELAIQTQGPVYAAIGARNLALFSAELGLVEEARAVTGEMAQVARTAPLEILAVAARIGTGHVELACGNLKAAGDALRELPARVYELGWNDSVQPLWADSIETLTRLGDLDRARTYLERYEQNAERLPSPYGVATAARCRGLLAAAEGNLDAAFAAYEHALATLEGLDFPLARGRVLLNLGSAQRQAKKRAAARTALEQALTLFEDLDAKPWAEQTRAELRRISGRRPSDETLTETEDRVARLAAQGHSNKEIAAALFMSIHTVEAHLTHVYRKLEIRSRGQLASRLLSATDPSNA
jgi:DNA-binding CsgD family transcriptional regulator